MDDRKDNALVESLRIVLAFIVQMKWILIIGVGLWIAYTSGVRPEDLLNWLKEMAGTIGSN